MPLVVWNPIVQHAISGFGHTMLMDNPFKVPVALYEPAESHLRSPSLESQFCWLVLFQMADDNFLEYCQLQEYSATRCPSLVSPR